MKKLLSIFLAFWLFCFFFPSSAYAQDTDCIGSGLANYIAEVFEGLGITPGSSGNSFGRIRFLSPAFNLTNPSFPALVSELNNGLSSRGYSLNNFYAIAGNAYNTSWGLISDFVDTARGTAIGGKKIILTEIGWYPHKTSDRESAVGQLKNEIDQFGGKNVIGGLIFNVFGNNSQFAAQSMTDDEIDTACSGNCSLAGVGANSARQFYSPSFYEDARRNKMAYTLEIASVGDLNSVVNGVNDALHGTPGMTPIVRLGSRYGSGGFADPSDLVAFIQDLNSLSSGDVYLILGPNEPLSECWATPNCECGESPTAGEPITISGSNLVCADIPITKEETIKEGTPPAVAGASTLGIISWLSNQLISGRVELEKARFPDFSRFSRSMVTGLKKLLPQELAQNMSPPGDTTLYFRHIPLIKNPSGDWILKEECGEVPKGTDKLQADLWGKLGVLRGICGFMGTGICSPVSNFQFQLAETDYPSCDYIHSCAPGGREVEEEDMPDPVTEIAEFSFLGWIRQVIEYLAGLIKKTKTTQVLVLSRSKLAGASEIVQNSNVLRRSLPQEVIEKIKPKGGESTMAMTEFFDYTYSLSPDEDEKIKGQYYGLEPMWKNYCLDLCGQHPGEINISDIDSICPSCDPDDYETPAEPRSPCEDPDDTPGSSTCPLPEGCSWNPVIYSCDYGWWCIDDENLDCEDIPGTATLEHGCADGQGPLCEGCKDGPYGLYVDKDIDWCGKPENKRCEGSVKCKWIQQEDWKSDTYSDSSYNGCYYASGSIKVRKDGVGGCFGLCSGACPAD